MLLVIYKNPKNRTQKTTLHRILYGFTDYSNKGKYKYERKGLIQEGGMSKVSRNTLLVDESRIEYLKNIIAKLGGEIIINQLKQEEN